MMPTLGGSSQITERRAGNFNGSIFVEHPGGSLIQDRATHPNVQERVLPGHNVIAQRASLTITIAPPGTVINGWQFTVPAALGNKIIHPFSDFLLHDIGTGDGIVQNGGQATRNRLRTVPASCTTRSR